MTYELLHKDCIELTDDVQSVKLNFDNVICVIETEHGFTLHCVGGFNLFLSHDQKANLLGNLKAGVKNE